MSSSCSPTPGLQEQHCWVWASQRTWYREEYLSLKVLSVPACLPTCILLCLMLTMIKVVAWSWSGTFYKAAIVLRKWLMPPAHWINTLVVAFDNRFLCSAPFAIQCPTRSVRQYIHCNTHFHNAVSHLCHLCCLRFPQQQIIIISYSSFNLPWNMGWGGKLFTVGNSQSTEFTASCKRHTVALHKRGAYFFHQRCWACVSGA